MTHPNLGQSLKYFDWLWGQATMSGWLYIALGLALVIGGYAYRRDHTALPVVLLPLATVLPSALATLGWATSNSAERTAAWVPPATLACLIVWLLAAVGTAIVARRQVWLILLCVLLSAPVLLLSALVATMSGTGDWI